jgi:hypothetical protein
VHLCNTMPHLTSAPWAEHCPTLKHAPQVTHCIIRKEPWHDCTSPPSRSQNHSLHQEPPSWAYEAAPHTLGGHKHIQCRVAQDPAPTPHAFSAQDTSLPFNDKEGLPCIFRFLCPNLAPSTEWLPPDSHQCTGCRPNTPLTPHIRHSPIPRSTHSGRSPHPSSLPHTCSLHCMLPQEHMRLPSTPSLDTVSSPSTIP